MSEIGRDDVLGALRGLLPTIGSRPDDLRIVGTASSLLRGIELPVGDVDILARTRPVVDELGEVIAGVGTALCGPEWEQESPAFGQYYAEYEVAAVSVQLSTVEMDPTRSHPPGECSEHWPWEHFDVIDVEGHRVALVASELRLQTEVVRGRPERYRPIGRHLARHGYDDGLLTTLTEALPASMRDTLWAALR